MGVGGGILIREMRSDDLDEVLELERAVFRTPWSRKVFQDEMEADGRSYLVADHAGRVVGYGGLMVVGPDAHMIRASSSW